MQAKATLRKWIAPYYKNLRGWRTDRKIIVIESDDWGSIRMPSKEVYEKCLKAGYPVDQNPYERYDSLASESDLELLFELLSKFKDSNGKNPVFTANVLTANPDFDKIRESNFKEYHYELATETLNKYPEHSKCFDLWMQGLESGLFFPQSHGREHLNSALFMDALQKHDRDAHFGFMHNMPGSVPKSKKAGRNDFVIALKYFNQADKELKKSIFVEGLTLFETLFGYKSDSFIPPNYWWSPDFDEAARRNGVRYYQGNRVMMEPGLNGRNVRHTYTFGEENKFGQRYLIRNTLFEPSLFRMKIDDPVGECLRNISIAFKMKKPAIICSHRINYVGFIDLKNRDTSLRLLNELLTQITKRWPEVEFMTSAQLGMLI